MVKKMKFTIDENGEVQINVLEAKGNECIEMTKDFEEALGEVKNKNLKDSYYEENEENLEAGDFGSN